MNTDNPIRILIAEGRELMREGLAAILSAQGDMQVIARTSTGEETVQCFRQHRPQITLMEIRLPGLDGVDTIRKIRHASPAARIVVLTHCEGDEDISRCLQAGVKAYLLKDVSVEELARAIHTVHAGQTYIPAPIAAKLAERMARPELTVREMDVLRLMVQGKSNLQIARTLRITESTVKTHVNSILAKLNVCDRTQAVTTALKRGIARLV